MSFPICLWVLSLFFHFTVQSPDLTAEKQLFRGTGINTLHLCYRRHGSHYAEELLAVVISKQSSPSTESQGKMYSKRYQEVCPRPLPERLHAFKKTNLKHCTSFGYIGILSLLHKERWFFKKLQNCFRVCDIMWGPQRSRKYHID